MNNNVCGDDRCMHRHNSRAFTGRGGEAAAIQRSPALTGRGFVLTPIDLCLILFLFAPTTPWEAEKKWKRKIKVVSVDFAIFDRI